VPRGVILLLPPSLSDRLFHPVDAFCHRGRVDPQIAVEVEQGMADVGVGQNEPPENVHLASLGVIPVGQEAGLLAQAAGRSG